MSHKPWYGNGLRFECTRCGNCCQNHGEYAYVYLTPEDVSAIAQHLGVTPRSFLESYCERDRNWVVLRMDRPACPFLEQGNRCAIYPVRPKQCATWPFWRENMRRATWEGPVSACCPGIGQGELVPVQEIERQVRETDEWNGDA